MKKNKVFHIITGLNVGGAETFLFNYMSRLDSDELSNITVVSLTDAGFYGEKLKSLGVTVEMLNFSTRIQSLLPSAILLFRLILLSRGAFVYFWMYHSMFISLFFKVTSKNIIWMVRRSLDGKNTLKLSTRVLVKFCALTSRFLPDVIVYNSNSGLITHADFGYSPKSAIVINNGVDASRYSHAKMNRYDVRRQLSVPADAFLVISVGRMESVKGPDVLKRVILETLKNSKNIYFVIVGRFGIGYDAQYFTNDLGESDQSRVVFTGQVHDVHNYLLASDVLVNCSYCEGFPNAVAEAMASGVVPIVTDVGDSAYLVGKEWLVVQPGDSGLMVEVIMRLNSDRFSHDQISKYVISRVTSEFSFDVAVSKIRNLSKNLDEKNV